MEKEIWKSVKGYENYSVSNYGRIKSLGNDRSRKEKILKSGTTKKGYLNVAICKNGKIKTFLVHRIVAEAFPEICGELFDGCEIDHIDTNKKNNNANNLRCVTPRENANNPLTKRHISEKILGKKHPEEVRKKISEARSKKVLQLDKLTNEIIAEFPSVKEVQEKLGFNRGSISRCCTGNLKSAYGYIWRYKNE